MLYDQDHGELHVLSAESKETFHTFVTSNSVYMVPKNDGNHNLNPSRLDPRNHY